MNVLIPAAGQGLRFIAAGYKQPKPFIPINGKPMVQHVIESGPKSKLTMLGLRPGYAFDHAVKALPAHIFLEQVPLHEIAFGTAGTVAHCAAILPLDEPVLVINSDNVITPAEGWPAWEQSVLGHAAAVITWRVDRDDPAAASYSYAQVTVDGLVRRVAEKEAISQHACAGAFYFSSAALLYTACRLEIDHGALVQGEHYLAPALNQLIARGCNVLHSPLTPDSLFVRIGTPEDLPNAERLLWT